MKYLIILILKIYQLFLSPFLVPSCRFLPTCSEYSKQAFLKYGFIKGLQLTLNRILRCRPSFSKQNHTHGFDPLL